MLLRTFNRPIHPLRAFRALSTDTSSSNNDSIPYSSSLNSHNDSHNSGISSPPSFHSLTSSRTSTPTFHPSPQIPPPTLKRILTSTQRTPTSFNLQPYAVILVSEDDQKLELAKTMLGGNYLRVRDSCLTAIFLADLQPSKRLPRLLGEHIASRRSRILSYSELVSSSHISSDVESRAN